MARVLGVDLGARRIGLACSDASGTLASPLKVLVRSGDRTRDHAAIVDAARDAEVERIVVGLPRSLDGSEGPAAKAVHLEADELQAAAGSTVVIELHDERLTTVIAERRLADAGVKGRARGKVVDAAAATEILLSWIEAQS
jgi:putative Holliday junction resolvase